MQEEVIPEVRANYEAFSSQKERERLDKAKSLAVPTLWAAHCLVFLTGRKEGEEAKIPRAL